MRELGGNEEAVTAKRYGVSFWGDKYVVKLIMMVTQLCEYTKKKATEFYTLYLNKAITIILKSKAEPVFNEL